MFDFGDANEQQREAIQTTEGPLLIIAGPGTGKTFDEVGCIHTSQGMEFEYVGLIIGDDLIYRDGHIETDYTKHPPGSGEFKRPHQKKPDAADKEIIDTIIRNTYKVLFTRGQKGLYLYIMDEELRNHLKIEVNKVKDQQARLKAYAEKISSFSS